METILPFVLFVVGVVVLVWSTERLLDGLVGLAGLLRVSAFAIAAVLSGFETENVAEVALRNLHGLLVFILGAELDYLGSRLHDR